MAADKPAVSVILPNRNHGAHLEATLLSHVGQSLPPKEIVVVDDGSTDDSCAIVERLAERYDPIRLIRHDRHYGVNRAVDTGLRETSGEYVRISSADDLIQPDFIEKTMAILAANPEAGFCCSDPAEIIGDTGSVRRFGLFLSTRPVYLPPAEIYTLMQRNPFTFSSNSIIYRRQAMVDAGGFIDALQWQSDWFINLVAALRHGVCYVPEVLSVYRVDPNSYSAAGMSQSEVQRQLVCSILDYFQRSEYSDLAPIIRKAGLIPEYRFRTLYWLLCSARHRRFITPRLIRRIFVRGVWSYLRPYTSTALRRALRRTSNAIVRST